MSIRGPVVVVLAADSMFTKQLAAAIASIQRSATREHQVYVLHDAYEPALIEQISGIAGDARQPSLARRKIQHPR